MLGLDGETSTLLCTSKCSGQESHFTSPFAHSCLLLAPDTRILMSQPQKPNTSRALSSFLSTLPKSTVSGTELHLAESHLPQPQLRSKPLFLSLHPARTDNKFWCNFSFPTVSYNTLFPNRARGVRGSDVEPPEPPAHLGRVTCQHSTGYSSTDPHPCQQLPQNPKK